jgi:hypothetical protein
MAKPLGVVERGPMQQVLKNVDSQSMQPSSIQDRISYGIITDVIPENYHVKVKLNEDKKEIGDKGQGGAWLSLITQRDDIHLRFGRLRKGMACKVHWRGKLDPARSNPFVEIVGDEFSSLARQDNRENKINTNPFKIFHGGLPV